MTTHRDSPGGEETFVLLDDNLDPEGRSLFFEAPVEIVVCREPEEVPAALARLAQARAAGLTAAGFLSYELGYLLEPKLAPELPAKRPHPLLWMALFERVRELDPLALRALLAERQGGGYTLVEPHLSWSEARYLEAFRRVKDYIAAGDVYQINLTLKHRFRFKGNPFDLYAELSEKQRSRYGAMIACEDFTVLSRSPELFLKADGRDISTRPMKGTAPRGRTPEEDADIARWLKEDEKSRAENLMIVDLLRNDLGRRAETGSVQVEDLFTVERYPTLHQMTSGIRARMQSGTDFADLLRALFPCGSITGAPKVRAMEIIRELEDEPRGLYTGAIGMVPPSADLVFNVAIRSLWIPKADEATGWSEGEMGLGSGVVYDSDGPAEFQECLLKGAFLTQPYEAFYLIETLRWESQDDELQGYYLLDRHLARLKRSAAHFLYPYNQEQAIAALESAAAGFTEACYRVRLTLDAGGDIAVTAAPMVLPGPDALYGLVISDSRVDSRDTFLYHKTSRRALYDGEHAKQSAATGCDEVLFLNERGELAEGSRMNLFIRRDGALQTPPLSAGLLDGTLRRELLDRGEAVEKTLFPEDLDRAEAVFVGNSLRGLVPARRLPL